MRKMMTKEVTHTTITASKLVSENGVATIQELAPLKVLGNVNMDKAQRLVNKEYGSGTTVLTVEPETVVYELPVEKFLEIATIKQDPAESDESAE